MNQPGLRLSREREIVWVRGRIQDNVEHRHHALQVTWARRGAPLTVSVAGEARCGSCAIIDGGVPHDVTLDDGLIALVDASSPLAKRLRDRLLDGEPFAVLEGVFFDPEVSHDAHLRGLAVGDAASLDARVRGVLDWLDVMESSGSWAEVKLERALEHACLSKSRFLHLFSSHVGSPWRTYLVWRRALVAITLASEGATLTRAAHQAGYADSAHLSRQFLALFGFSPSALLRNSQFVQSD
jgi:AraC-like DNA-binding protein